MLNPSDQEQIAEHGLSTEQITYQIDKFKAGFPPSDLVKPAIVDDGIVKFSEKEQKELIDLYENNFSNLDIVKFVPASGAASRMFKKLFAFIDEYKGTDTDYEKLTADQGKGSMYAFFKSIEKFAFYELLKKSFQPESLEEQLLKKNYVEIVKKLLLAEGLNYGALPKGLLQFHNYPEGSRTPVEEHMVEGAQYAKSAGNKVKIHFTVSPEHQEKFEEHIAEIKPKYEAQFGVKIEVSYSQQKPSTDTIAVDLSNEPFRNADGSLLFRPAGHGALLANLNDIEADLIFLKNIDNVVPDSLKEETIVNKKVIAGVLIQYQAKIKEAIADVKAGNLDQATQLLETMGYVPGSDFQALSSSDKSSFILEKLRRPLRICGMVKNDGDTGGGPFWVKATDGSISLQVVETAQINLDDAEQKKIFSSASHFNPVDVACYTKDPDGNKIDLMKHRDMDTCFISQKSKDGKDLRAMELPGLWNGSMADWNTVFVEVPLITFNPVKSVTDLLEPEHQ
ncbi:DUF4301 family protein [Marinoscillum sp. MHG1-6]|uniref:DUF4301 family protein n=1 Tax=Marinoscillum sp. MHG1-6 TaxID=2959627 RepID=UPI002157FA89|nr:DUF4301 family protein [Marinoscillum sp. MHG1-6]